MNPDTEKSSDESIWFIPPTIVQLADGVTMIKPGKAIQRASPAHTEKLTGVSIRSLSQLADCGLIRRVRPTPGTIWYYPAEIVALIKRTEEDPDFWDEVRRDAYLTGKRLTS